MKLEVKMRWRLLRLELEEVKPPGWHDSTAEKICASGSNSRAEAEPEAIRVVRVVVPTVPEAEVVVAVV